MFDKKTYREAVSSLHASGEILQEVKNMTHQKKKPFRLSRTIALAAVITTLCAVAAIAASGFIRYENPGAMLRAFFGKNVDSSEGIVEYDEAGRLITNVPAWERLPLDESVAQELVAPYLFAAGGQAVYGHYTLTVEAGLYDPVVGAGLLYCRVAHPDGVSGYEVFPDGELWWPEDAPVFTTTTAAGRTYLDTASTTDDTLWLCTYFITDDASLQVSIGNGQNRLDMSTVTVALPESGGLADVTLAEGAVTLSPIGIRIDETALGLPQDSDIDRLILHYADGSDYTVEDDEAFVSNRTYALIDHGTSVYTFNRIVDTQAVISVTIDDVQYPVS
ncbi:hypothetical protein [uncultured Intestinimonas sp.]|uniref:hypothetical protein n=1 Tax=uncultured Intestinimonas sp. TaxID=1689265 RepID=UPI0025FFDFA1|nr:hypothetical protein [uncultured Intestinimonas sp.]